MQKPLVGESISEILKEGRSCPRCHRTCRT